MNPFYDISEEKVLSDDALQLKNLGCRKTTMSFSTGYRDEWGQNHFKTTHATASVKSEDYDRLFALRLLKSKPIYRMTDVLDYHLNYYLSKNPKDKASFFTHMRYVVLVQLKQNKSRFGEAAVSILEDWLNDKSVTSIDNKNYAVNNNTINVGAVNAPIQIQQNSAGATQHQYNQYNKEDVHLLFDLLRKDIQNLDENIRKDFEMEMNYAIAQLEKGRDIKPQLSNLGASIKEIGIGAFSGLLASTVFETGKSLLGI
ncbi:hypothetical protein [Olivibacter jilunii]|uniref:hypothetical protein n=1 Tax=Olivibacter jilunii TaxID=985016 RepID=UPI003F160903